MTFESSSKSRKSWNELQFGNAFQIFEATDERDLEVAMVVLRGEHILTKIKMSGGSEMVDIGLTQIVTFYINVLI